MKSTITMVILWGVEGALNACMPVLSNYEFLFQFFRPGGLYIEFPLSDWPLNAIFEKIIDANFDVDLIEEESREGARVCSAFIASFSRNSLIFSI